MDGYAYASQGVPQANAYLSPAPNARAASIYDTNPEHHGVTIDANEIINNAPQGFGQGYGYQDEDNDSDYVDDDDDDGDDRSYYDVGPASGYAGRMNENGLNGMRMRGVGDEDDDEEEIDLSRRPSTTMGRHWQRRGSIGGKGFGLIKRIPAILGRRRKHHTTSNLMPPDVYTPLGPPAPPSIRSHYSDLPDPDAHHQHQAPGSLHSHPSQHEAEPYNSPESLHSHYSGRHDLVAVNGDPQTQQEVPVLNINNNVHASPHRATTTATGTRLFVPGEDPSSPGTGQTSMRRRRSASASVPSINIDVGSSPPRSAFHSSNGNTTPHRSRSQYSTQTRSSPSSSHGQYPPAHSHSHSRSNTNASTSTSSTLAPNTFSNSAQHLMHHHTSAPSSRRAPSLSPSVYPPSQAYHETHPYTPLGQLARTLDTVFRMPWHDHDQVADVYLPELSSSRSHRRVAEAAAAAEAEDGADKRRVEETQEALALHGQSWYYPSKTQVLKRMRRRALGRSNSSFGTRFGFGIKSGFGFTNGGGGGSALARGASNASSAQYLLAPAYAYYGDSHVAPQVPRSQPSVGAPGSLHTYTVMTSPNLTTSPPGSYAYESPAASQQQHQVYAYPYAAPGPGQQQQHAAGSFY